jgi:predicted transcriptional regulator
LKLFVVIFGIKTDISEENEVTEYPPLGHMRILMFMSKSPKQEFTKGIIQKNIGGESWDRLSKYLADLYEKELIDMENKTATLGHIVFKINSRGMEAVEKYKDWRKFFGRSDGDE